MAKILNFPKVAERASTNMNLRNRQYTDQVADVLLFPGVRNKQLAFLSRKIPEGRGPRWKIDTRTK